MWSDPLNIFGGHIVHLTISLWFLVQRHVYPRFCSLKKQGEAIDSSTLAEFSSLPWSQCLILPYPLYPVLVALWFISSQKLFWENGPVPFFGKNILCLGIKGSAMSVQRVKKYAGAVRVGSEVWCVKNISCNQPFKGIGERNACH